MSEDPQPAVVPAEQAAGHRSNYLVKGVVALGVLVVIAVIVNVVFLSPKTVHNSLAGSSVATNVANVIQAQQKDHTPPDVTCPPVVHLQAGATFDCVLHEKPHDAVVVVTQTDNRGDLDVKLTDRTPGP